MKAVLGLVIVCLVSTAALSQDAEPQSATYRLLNGRFPEIGLADKIRVLLVADEFAEDLEKNDLVVGDAVQNYFLSVFRYNRFHPEFKDRLIIDRIGARRPINPEVIERYYSDLQVNPTDTLVFYYVGHGAGNPRGGHVLTMSKGKIQRTKLRLIMEAKNARKVIILTDSCYFFPEDEPRGEQRTVSLRPEGEPIEYKERDRVATDLFLRGLGTVDLQSSSPGEITWSHEGMSIFSKHLLEILSDPPPELDKNHDGFTSWDEVHQMVTPLVEEDYQSFRKVILSSPRIAVPAGKPDLRYYLEKSEHQIPYALSVPFNLTMSKNVTLVSEGASAGENAFFADAQLYFKGLGNEQIQQDLSFRYENGDSVRGIAGSSYNSVKGVVRDPIRMQITDDHFYTSRTFKVPYSEIDAPSGTVLTPVIEAYLITGGQTTYLGGAKLPDFRQP